MPNKVSSLSETNKALAFDKQAVQMNMTNANLYNQRNTQLIGREANLDTLRHELTQMHQKKHRRVILITGPAGVGKSQLIETFQHSAGQSSASIYQSSTPKHTQLTALSVIVSLLRSILSLSETDNHIIQLQALQVYLDRLHLNKIALLPYLARAFGLPQANPQLEEQLNALDATILQRQTYSALRQIILAEASIQPTVLIFDNYQWLDTASREFLAHLIHTTDDVPLLLVLASRNSDHQDALKPILSMIEKSPQRMMEMQLEALSNTHGQLLVNQLIRDNTSEAKIIKEEVLARAAGNPLFVEEIIYLMIDQGALVRETPMDDWRITPYAKELLDTVPETVHGLLKFRFDNLREDLQQVLRLASVLGTSFSTELLQQISHKATENLSTQLNILETNRFLLTAGPGLKSGYAFRQVLLQEAIYNSIKEQDRRNIHLNVGEAIEHYPQLLPEEQTELLAYHYAESSQPIKAIPYLITAAENLARRCAHASAIAHLYRARAIQKTDATDDDDTAPQIGIGLGRSLTHIGEFADASQILLETLEVIQKRIGVGTNTQLSHNALLIECLLELAGVRLHEGTYMEALAHLEAGLEVLGNINPLEQSSFWYKILDRLAIIRFRQGKLDIALSLATKAVAELIVAETQSPTDLASLYNIMGGISWQQGNLTQAVTYVERSLELYESVQYSWGAATAKGNLGILLQAQGKWSEAIRYYEQAYLTQKAQGNPEGQATSLDNIGVLNMNLGRHSAAEVSLEDGLAIRQRLGDAWGIAQSHVNLAQLAIIRANIDQAKKHIDTVLSMIDELGSSEIQIEALWMQALILAEMDCLSDGLQSVSQALEMAQTGGLMEKVVDCLRVTGVLMFRNGQHYEAETALRDSETIARTQNNPYRQGLALLELGTLYAHSTVNNTDGNSKATTVLTEARALFERLDASFDFQRTLVLLNQISN